MPFFGWLVAQPEFLEGRFHTTYLDEVLKARDGRPFVEATPDVEEVAAIAAALQAVLSPSTLTPEAPGDGRAAGAQAWRTRARLEGVRAL